MATVLFVWELGGGSGHLTRNAPLAKALKANGHDVYLVAKNLISAERLFAGSGVHYLQAPTPHVAIAPAFPQPSSYAHILHNIGFGYKNTLHELTSAWSNIYRLTSPDLIVLDHRRAAACPQAGTKRSC